MRFSANYKKILGRSAICLGVITLLGSGCATVEHEHARLKVDTSVIGNATGKAEAAAEGANAAAGRANRAADRAEAAAGKAADAAARAESAAKRAERAAAKSEAVFEKSMKK